MLIEYFLGCLGASIARISHGRTGYLPGKVCRKGIMDIVVWFLKLWLMVSFVLGMLFWHG
jgi:hypothetical protein